MCIFASSETAAVRNLLALVNPVRISSPMRHTKKSSKPFRFSDNNGKSSSPSYGGAARRAGPGKKFSSQSSSDKTAYGKSNAASPLSGRTDFDKKRGRKTETDRQAYGKSSKPFSKTSAGKSSFGKPYTKTSSEGTALGDTPRYGKTSRKPLYTKSFSKPPFGKPPYVKSDSRTPSAKPREQKPLRQNTPWQAPEKTNAESIFLWGVHAVRAAWNNPQRRCYRLWLSDAGQEHFATFGSDAQDQLLKRPDPKHVDRVTLDHLIPPNSVHQGIILEAAPLHQPSLSELVAANPPPDLILVLDQVTDPHNVGAILRSAQAFGAGGVIMTERNAPDTTGVLAKTASGAIEHLPVVHVVNLSRALDELHEAGYWSVGLAEEGTKDLAALDLTGRTVLLLGAEGPGLRQLTRKKCHELARLPTGEVIGSLNVSNAAAVALYEVKRQRKI